VKILSFWAFIKRFWPVLAVIAVAIALWAWGNSRYDDGYDKATLEGIEAAAAATKAMQGALDAAEARDTVERVKIVTRFKPIRERATNAPNDPTCPDAGTRQLLDEAVRAANDPAASAKGE
jgi:hypothetical protein